MSQQVAANSQKLYTQTLPLASLSVSVGGMFSPALATSIGYVIDGNWISLILPQTVAASTNPSAELTIGTLPQAIWPRSTQNIPCLARIGVNTVTAFANITTAGVLKIVASTTSSPPGQAGFESQSISYPIA